MKEHARVKASQSLGALERNSDFVGMLSPRMGQHDVTPIGAHRW
jgi:hypothetical protein